MNVVFVSPDFPSNYFNFCIALKRLGVKVLGISQSNYQEFRQELKDSLAEYFQVEDLHDYDKLLRAVAYLTYRHGKIDRLDSLNEYWLETEAHLRTDFNIEGFKLADLPKIKRKSHMKKVFEQAGVEVARGHAFESREAARAFVEEVGYPVVAKPDIGVGAAGTFKIDNQRELEDFLAGSPEGYFFEEYVQGVIQTFDGLADRDGNPVFFASMQYSAGVMEIVNRDDDQYYFTKRIIPADIEAAGRRILKAFGVRERFFHFEFFRTGDDRLVALEVNMRPPGGLTIDMFNYANNINLYQEYANMVVRGSFEASYDWPYYCCYVGRKSEKPYLHTHSEVVSRYGDYIVHHEGINGVFRRAMGDYGYLVRASELEEILEAARFIQLKR